MQVSHQEVTECVVKCKIIQTPVSRVSFIFFFSCKLPNFLWMLQGLFVLQDIHEKLASLQLNTLRPRQNGRHLADAIFKWIFMPTPLGAGGIMFSGCPSVRPKPEIPSFDLYMGPLVHPTNCDHFTACPSVCLSVEVSGHLPENAWRKCPEILHADASWPSSELISLWPQSVDFSNFGTIFT